MQDDDGRRENPAPIVVQGRHRVQKTIRKAADDVLAFLDRQRLAATPANYALGFQYITGTNTALCRSITEVTDGGVRMTQDEADEIMMRCGLTPAGQTDEPRTDAAETARMQLLRLADITSSQSAATTRFGRDLSDGMERMGSSGADLAGIVSAMIQRTEAAERELSQLNSETDRLRRDLEAARNDANKDALTALPNRRAVDALLGRLEKEGKRRTLAFCDVDRFKRINDTYGHHVGDRVLKMVASVLAETCAKHGTVARWGGEEFVVVFENHGVRDAAAIIDAARETLGARNFKVRDTDEPLGRVTFSAGVAEGDGITGEIAGRADKLLYAAKDQGRDRVVTA